MKFEQVEQKKVHKEMLPQIVNRIFSICKTDTNFPLREQIGGVDRKIAILKQRIIKQNGLFKQSQKLTFSLNQRITILEDRNANLKERLIESLGSEL